jgi:hypothetical protein
MSLTVEEIYERLTSAINRLEVCLDAGNFDDLYAMLAEARVYTDALYATTLEKGKE